MDAIALLGFYKAIKPKTSRHATVIHLVAGGHLAYLPQCVKRMLEMEVDKSALNHLVAAILDNSYPGLTYSGSHTMENAELCGKAIFSKILRLKQERDDIQRGTALICPTPADRDVIPSVG